LNYGVVVVPVEVLVRITKEVVVVPVDNMLKVFYHILLLNK
jgi:hypothetical protein